MKESQAGEVTTGGTSTGMRHHLVNKDEYELGIQNLHFKYPYKTFF